MNPAFDKWEDTEAALSAAQRLLILLHNEPDGITKDELKAELKEVRAWCVQIHNRRIALNMRKPAAPPDAALYSNANAALLRSTLS